MFEGIAWTGSKDIFSDSVTGNVNYDSKNVNVDSVQQKPKVRHSHVNMFPTNRQAKNTGPSIKMKCKIDTGAGANLMSLDDYKKVNSSESGNSLAAYSHDRTTLKVYCERTIKQYGVRIMNCHWNNLFIKPIFHIVEAKGPILLGLTTLRKIGIF